MRVLVTGGSGFIGTNLVDHYLKRGATVLNVDTESPRNEDHLPYWKQADIRDAGGLREVVTGFAPDVVLHMAARTDLLGRAVSEYAANTEGVSNLIAALRASGTVKIAVFASSMLVCRIGYRPHSETDYRPSTAYGESKIEGELRVRREAAGHFPWVILRPTSIWGPWFGPPYRDFFTAVQRGWYVHPSGRRVRRNYGFILNSVHQVDRLVAAGGGELISRTVYLADYEPIELKEWADLIQKHLQTNPVRELPMLLFRAAALGGDVLLKLGVPRVPMSSFRLNNLLTETLHDTTPLERVAGPLPYDTPRAVALTCDWLRSAAARGR